MANDTISAPADSLPVEALEAAVQSLLALHNIVAAPEEQRAVAKALRRLAPPHLAAAIQV